MPRFLITDRYVIEAENDTQALEKIPQLPYVVADGYYKQFRICRSVKRLPDPEPKQKKQPMDWLTPKTYKRQRRP